MENGCSYEPSQRQGCVKPRPVHFQSRQNFLTMLILDLIILLVMMVVGNFEGLEITVGARQFGWMRKSEYTMYFTSTSCTCTLPNRVRHDDFRAITEVTVDEFERISQLSYLELYIY